MLTEDYLMRMISQAIAVLIAALGFKKSKKYKEALQAFNQAVESLLGLDSHLVDQLEDKVLIDKLTFMGQLDVERVLVLADIYREQAEVYSSLGQPENNLFAAQRSLRLYLEAALAGDEHLSQELILKIEGLRHNMKISNLPVETRLALQDYLDRLLASDDELLAAHSLSRSSLQADLSTLDRLGTQ